eukprot:SAG11_NODE_2568_length_3214_cov_2.670947_4_plen_59_part_00
MRLLVALCACSWADGREIIDGKAANAAFPSPGGAPSIAIAADGAILLGRYEAGPVLNH